MSAAASTLAWLQLVRAPALFTALSNIFAAQVIVSGGAPAPLGLALLGAASLAIYAAGMILNDCFDYAEDARERPFRPLPSGRVARRAAATAGFALMLAGVVLASLQGPVPAAVAVLLCLAVLAYDGGLKRTPLGPPAMGLCRYLNWMLGLSIVPLGSAELLLGLPVFFYICALTLVSSQETRAENRRPLWLAGACLVLAGASVAGLLAAHRAEAIAWLGLLAAGAVTAWYLLRAGRVFAPAALQALMRTLIFGVVILDSVLLLGLAGAGWALLNLLLLLPGRLIAKRIYVT